MATPTSVDVYLAGLPQEQRAALEKVRKTIKAAAPGVVETISYEIPAFKLQGRSLVWFAAFKNHMSLYPASVKVRRDLEKDLKPYFSGKGTIRFTVEKPIPATLLKKIVKTRIKENEELARR